MKVFIEQGGQPNIKNIFDKASRVLLGTEAFHVSYPYPYVHIPGTRAEDGDEIDCFIITDKLLKPGSMIEVEVIGLLECFDNGEADHKVLACLPGETCKISDRVKDRLQYFNDHFYDNRPGKKAVLGEYFNREAAEQFLNI